jgi:hypothetical protein
MSASGIARNDGSQNVHFIGKDIVYNTVGIGTADTVKVGRIPAGSMLCACYVRITTAFNAATTNVLTVGQNATADTDIVAAGELNEGVTGTTVVLTGCRADLRQRYRHLCSVHADRNGGDCGRCFHRHHLHPPELVRKLHHDISCC